MSAAAGQIAPWVGVALSLAALTAGAAAPLTRASPGPGQVVLLHGLARSERSMAPIARTLTEAEYVVCNVAYPSRRHDVTTLARQHVAPAIDACDLDASAPIHFVTHSMGAIVLRRMAASGLLPNIGRVVMLAPPNRGSEIVDRFGGWTLFRLLNGPAGTELGTAPSALPARLGPVPFTAGVIAGTRSVNPLLSCLIPGVDDGKVGLDRARVDGMHDYLAVPASHPLIMRSRDVQAQTLYFLEHGAFDRRT
jgi:triacylglycerol lipase